MKQLAVLIFLLGSSLFLFSEGFVFVPRSPELKYASIHGAQTKVVFRVVDDTGAPIQGVRIGVGFYLNKAPGKNPRCSGFTDKDGVFVAEEKSAGEVNYSASKKGFYETRGTFIFRGTMQKRGKVKDGKWQPYGKEILLVLKPIRKPILLVGENFPRQIFMSTNHFTCGFDMEKFDWCAPHGNGKVSDFEFTYHSDGKKYNDYRWSTLTMRFVRPYDGAYIAEKDRWSELQMCHEVDTNKTFQTKFSFSRVRGGEKGGGAVVTLNDDQYMVVRTRSRVDGQGRFVGAHYGLIKGVLMFGYWPDRVGAITLQPYFNPSFNDTNLECVQECEYRVYRENPELFKKRR